MVLTAREVHQLPASREIAEMVSTVRWQRGVADYFSNWHERIAAAQEGDEGQWSVMGPDGIRRATSEDGLQQNVQNYPHDAVRDHRRVVAESLASVTAKGAGSSDEAQKRAQVNIAIGTGYWEPYDELMIPDLVMDLELAGAAFVHCYANEELSDRPMHDRLIPGGCYPTFHRRRLHDMVYVERLPLRMLAEEYPGLGLSYNPKKDEWGEVTSFWNKKWIYKCVWALNSGSKQNGDPYTVYARPNPIGQVPIAWSANFDAKGRIEGLYDQAGARQNTKNRILSYIVENAKRMAYAQKKRKGVMNKGGGPGFEYELDPDIPDSDIQWIQPAPINPMLFSVLGELDRSLSSTVMMPPSRSGEVTQCLAPETRVLTDELDWVQVGTLKKGQKIAAFDEFPSRIGVPRRYRTAEVTEADRVRLPSYRVTLDDGTVIVASAKHQWLVQNRKRRLAFWLTTEQIVEKSKVRGGHGFRNLGAVKVIEPWAEPRTWAGGYLAGMFDGEGCLSRSQVRGGSLLVAVSQRQNKALEMTEALLEVFGYRASRHHANGGYPGSKEVWQLHLRGGKEEGMRFLGQIRPVRLLAKWQALGGTDCVGKINQNVAVGFRSIEFVGEIEVVSLGTTTQTLIAEGFAHHNSIASAAFIEASMGAESALVREDHRHLAWIRTGILDLDRQLDIAVLNKEKPLRPAVGRKDTYLPKKDIDPDIKLMVNYPGFGTGRLNETILLIQMAGSGMISWEDARSMAPGIGDYLEVARRIEEQKARELWFARIQQMAGPYTSTLFMKLFSQGKDLLEVADAILGDERALEEMRIQMPGAKEEGPVPSAEETALALEKGGVPPEVTEGLPGRPFEPPPLPGLPGAPSTQILAGRGP
jgi:hypothetical protein